MTFIKKKKENLRRGFAYIKKILKLSIQDNDEPVDFQCITQFHS